MAVTKQQLAAENVTLRNKLSELEGLLQRERFARESMEAEMAVLRKAAHAPTSDRRAAMNAAREEAMRTGRTVKVRF